MKTQQIIKKSGKLSALVQAKFGRKYQISSDPEAPNVVTIQENGYEVATYRFNENKMYPIYQANIDFEDYSGLIYDIPEEMETEN